MTSPAPLTEAQAAAARALAGDFECSWHIGCDEECRADMVRAVVAAVHDLIAAEALDQAAEDILTHRDELRSIPGMARGDLRVTARLRGLEEAAGVVRFRADTFRQSLSLPASKETPDA